MARNSNIEAARLAAFVGVVVLHGVSTGLFKEHLLLGFVLEELSRFSVPLFFMFSGFFLKPGPLQTVAVSWGKRLLIPYAAWIVIYAAVDVAGIFGPPSFAGTEKQIALLLMTGGPGFHLWFLPALWLGVVISVFLIGAIGKCRGSIFAAALFLTGAVACLYLRPFGVQLNPVWFRNGIFFAPIFIMIAYQFKPEVLPVSGWCAMAVAGTIGQIGEGYLFGSFPKGHDMSASTVVMTVGVFGAVTTARDVQSSFFRELGKTVFGAYLVHLLFLKIFSQLVEASSMASIFTSLLLTVLSSILFAYVTVRIPILSRVVSTKG